MLYPKTNLPSDTRSKIEDEFEFSNLDMICLKLFDAVEFTDNLLGLASLVNIYAESDTVENTKNMDE